MYIYIERERDGSSVKAAVSAAQHPVSAMQFAVAVVQSKFSSFCVDGRKPVGHLAGSLSFFFSH